MSELAECRRAHLQRLENVSGLGDLAVPPERVLGDAVPGGVIDVDIAPDQITMVLKDTGKGIADIELAMKEGYSTAPEEVRSLGFGAGMRLSNMKKYSDEMKIESTVNVGTTVTMKVNLS